VNLLRVAPFAARSLQAAKALLTGTLSSLILSSKGIGVYSGSAKQMTKPASAIGAAKVAPKSREDIAILFNSILIDGIIT
jgi:hypothetical protein